MKIDICNVCHPFYTGKQKVMDTAGRVEKFRQRYGTKGTATIINPTTGIFAYTPAAGRIGGEGSVGGVELTHEETADHREREALALEVLDAAEPFEVNHL